MLLVDGTVARLEEQVPQLEKKVQGALDLTELMRRKALPNYTPAVFVAPNGIAGGVAEFSTSMFVQAADELVSVVIVLRTAGDVRGARGQLPLHRLVWRVILALSGWAPDPEEFADEEEEPIGAADPVGVLVLRRGRLLSLDAGTAFYQLDFALSQQIRVLS